MAGPPEHIPPAELWLKLQELPRPHRLVDFPRKDRNGNVVGQVAMFVCTQEEHMLSAIEAERFAREYLKDAKKEELGYETVYSNEACNQVLFRACRDATDLTKPAFPSPKWIRQKLTTEECGRLFEHYLTVQLELGPVVSKLSEVEMEAWITVIAEGGSAFPFDLLSWETQRTLILFTARQLVSLRTGTSFVGLQPVEEPPSAEGDVMESSA